MQAISLIKKFRNILNFSESCSLIYMNRHQSVTLSKQFPGVIDIAHWIECSPKFGQQDTPYIKS
jgi:hypothetical protein